MNDPYVDGIFAGIILGRTQLNPLVTHFQLRLTARSFGLGLFLTELGPGALAWNVDLYFRLQWSLTNRLEEFEGFIGDDAGVVRSEEHTSELQSLTNLVCRLLLE